MDGKYGYAELDEGGTTWQQTLEIPYVEVCFHSHCYRLR